MRLTEDLVKANLARALRWHYGDGLKGWSALEWAGAMAGEAGEACNDAKKLRRIEQGLYNIPLGKLSKQTVEEFSFMVAKEAADTILYALLLIQRVGHDPEQVIQMVFNNKSAEYGFPERL